MQDSLLPKQECRTKKKRIPTTLFGREVSESTYQFVWDFIWTVDLAGLAFAISWWFPTLFVRELNVTLMMQNVIGAGVAAVFTALQQVKFRPAHTYMMYGAVLGGFCSSFSTFANFIENSGTFLYHQDYAMLVANIFGTVLLSIICYQICHELTLRYKRSASLTYDVDSLEKDDLRLLHEMEYDLLQERQHVAQRNKLRAQQMLQDSVSGDIERSTQLGVDTNHLGDDGDDFDGDGEDFVDGYFPDDNYYQGDALQSLMMGANALQTAPDNLDAQNAADDQPIASQHGHPYSHTHTHSNSHSHAHSHNHTHSNSHTHSSSNSHPRSVPSNPQSRQQKIAYYEQAVARIAASVADEAVDPETVAPLSPPNFLMGDMLVRENDRTANDESDCDEATLVQVALKKQQTIRSRSRLRVRSRTSPSSGSLDLSNPAEVTTRSNNPWGNMLNGRRQTRNLVGIFSLHHQLEKLMRARARLGSTRLLWKHVIILLVSFGLQVLSLVLTVAIRPESLFDFFISYGFACSGAYLGGVFSSFAQGGKSEKTTVQRSTLMTNIVGCLLIATSHNLLYFQHFFAHMSGDHLSTVILVLERFVMQFCGSFSNFAGLIDHTMRLANTPKVPKKIAVRNLLLNVGVCLVTYFFAVYMLKLTISLR